MNCIGYDVRRRRRLNGPHNTRKILKQVRLIVGTRNRNSASQTRGKRLRASAESQDRIVITRVYGVVWMAKAVHRSHATSAIQIHQRRKKSLYDSDIRTENPIISTTVLHMFIYRQLSTSSLTSTSGILIANGGHQSLPTPPPSTSHQHGWGGTFFSPSQQQPESETNSLSGGGGENICSGSNGCSGFENSPPGCIINLPFVARLPELDLPQAQRSTYQFPWTCKP